MAFRRLEHLKRYRQVINLLIRNGLGFVVDQLGLTWLKTSKKADYHQISVPERIRIVMEELGTTFVKVGQLLSMRPDLLPPEYVKEFEKLQDDVPPCSPDQVRKVLTEAGIDLEMVFQVFEFQPVASASIGQVHRAWLRDGREVAVKVLRPGVTKQVAIDLAILRDLAAQAEKRTRWGTLYQLSEVVKQFSEAISSEIDLSLEGRNASRMFDDFKDDPDILIPGVIWEYTSQQVLVMDYVEGIKISEIELLKASGADLRKVAQHIVNSLFKQIYEHGYFHSDPHSGNLAIAPGNRLVYYDFGQMGYVDELIKEQGMDMVLAMVRYDVDGVTRGLINLGYTTRRVDRRELKADVTRLRRKYYGMPIAEIKVGEAMNELLQLSVKHQLHVPPELSLMVKMLMTVESVLLKLDPALSITKIAEPLGRRILTEKRNPQKILGGFYDFLNESAVLARNIPRELETVLDLLQSGELKVRHENPDAHKIAGRAEAMVNRLSLAIVTASLVIGASLMAGKIPHNALQSIPLPEVAWGAAAVLGLLLIYSMWRGGRSR